MFTLSYCGPPLCDCDFGAFVFGSVMRPFEKDEAVCGRHPDVIDALSRVDTIVFDKTGRLLALRINQFRSTASCRLKSGLQLPPS